MPPRFLLVLLCLSGCDSERDSRDRALEASLDRAIAEATALSNDDGHYRREFEALRQAEVRCTPISETDLSSLAGPKTKVVWTTKGFYRAAEIDSIGTRAEALSLVRTVLARGEAQRLASLSLRADGFSASFLVQKAHARPHSFAGGGGSLGPKGSFCLADCRDRRTRIETKQAQLATLAAACGDLATVWDLKRTIDECEGVGVALSAPGWSAVVDQLEALPAFGAGATLTLSKGEGQVTGVPATLCDGLRGVKCEWNQPHASVVLELE